MLKGYLQRQKDIEVLSVSEVGSETLKSKGFYAALYDLHSEKVDNIASQGMQQVSKKKKEKKKEGLWGHQWTNAEVTKLLFPAIPRLFPTFSFCK